MTPENLLRHLFDVAVEAALPSHVLEAHLPANRNGRAVVIGAGKASAAMATTLEAVWTGPLSGLVITRYGHATPCRQIEIVEAAHPVPDAAGAAAAERMLQLCGSLGAEDHVIALISGGGSSLLTLMPDGLGLEDARALNRALLVSGASIDEMNCVRRHLSRTNGGRLAAVCAPASVLSLLISDVPGDDPVNIASGPTVGDPTTLSDAREIVARYGMDLPPAMTKCLNDPAHESIKPDNPRLASTKTRMIATPMLSLDAAEAAARALGHQVRNLGDRLEGEARDLGRQMARDALALQRELSEPLLILSGGETSVTIPKDGRALGAGGRNVDFLLGVLETLRGAAGITALACDTDGVDGLEEIAGAIVKPDSFARGEGTLEKALHSYDGHGFFKALGDQVVTGPTLTNVNDFRAFLVEPLQKRNALPQANG